MAITKTQIVLHHTYLIPLSNHPCNLCQICPLTPSLSHAFHHTINNFLPGIETCCPSLCCLQLTLTLPTLPVPCSHMWFCTYLIPLICNSIGSALHVPTAIAHCTIPTPTFLWRSCLEPMKPSTPTQLRVRQVIIHHRGPGPIHMSIWQLMRWKESGGTHKSDAEVTRLVHEILQAPDFNIHNLTNFDTSSKTCRMEAAQKKIPQEDLFGIDKWWCTSVNISVPTREKNKKGNGRTINGFHYRLILDVIHVVFAEASLKSFHLTPFKKLWKSPVSMSMTSCMPPTHQIKPKMRQWNRNEMTAASWKKWLQVSCSGPIQHTSHSSVICLLGPFIFSSETSPSMPEPTHSQVVVIQLPSSLQYVKCITMLCLHCFIICLKKFLSYISDKKDNPHIASKNWCLQEWHCCEVLWWDS